MSMAKARHPSIAPKRARAVRAAGVAVAVSPEAASLDNIGKLPFHPLERVETGQENERGKRCGSGDRRPPGRAGMQEQGVEAFERNAQGIEQVEAAERHRD